MNVFVENDGETPVKEFLLALEMPSNFPDGSTPYAMKIESAPPVLSAGLAPVQVRECE
jgi:hypothetical protein